MLSNSPRQHNPSPLDSLLEQARQVSASDRATQLFQPDRWLDIQREIIKGSSDLIEAGRLDDASVFLTKVYEAFNAAGMRGPCKAALAGMSRLFEQFQRSEPFSTFALPELAQGALTLPPPYPQEQVTFALYELDAWAAAAQLMPLDTAKLIGCLKDCVLTCVKSADLSWHVVHPRYIWRLHAATEKLLDYASSAAITNGTDAVDLEFSTRFLRDLIFALGGSHELSGQPADSSLRPLSYSADAALEEYLQLALPEEVVRFQSAITQGDAEFVYRKGISMTNYIGQVMCRLDEPAKLEAPFMQFMQVWRECWAQTRFTPRETKNNVRSSLSYFVFSGCKGLSLALLQSHDPHLLKRLVHRIDEFVASPESKDANIPASSLAPIKQLVGRLWEQVASLTNDKLAAEESLDAYLESSRLLAQTRFPLRVLVADVLSSIDRFSSVRPLTPAELGVLEYVRGNQEFRRKDFDSSVRTLTLAIEHLSKALTDRHALGLQNLTFMAGRAHEYAAEAARELGDRARSAWFLRKGADLLEDTAEMFVMPHARQSLLDQSDYYRRLAGKVEPKA